METQGMNLAGKHALVLGLGESGLAIAHWLARAGARLRVADTRPFPERLDRLRELVPTAEFIAGEFTASLLDAIDLVLLSPGLSPGKELAAILPAAQEKQIPVWGEIELFAQALSALKAERGYQPKVLAITGTNGKTTVTNLTGHLCRAAGLSVRVAGNISPAALDVLREALDQDSLPDCWVLELSSFQLWSTHTLDADAATVLNLTQDHLDWHGDMEAYAKAKQRIFGARTVRVLNRDDTLVMKMTGKDASVVSFGTDAPAEADYLGMTEEHGVRWLMLAVSTEEKSEKKRRVKAKRENDLFLNRLMPADALKIRGRHNAANVLAALALCRAIELPLAPLLHAARQYKGESHRVESVTAIAGVEYVDDSKGTNVGATIAALEGLGDLNAVGEPRLILIAGGDGKGQDFTPLAGPVKRHAKAVMLIGRDGPAIHEALNSTGVSLMDCWTLEQAVERAAEIAKEGDIVLLSPACASFDMFTNYAHRAEVFINAVRELGLSRGEVSA
jgi:UDP-N-acetylmuramoylalanine--D-glutamate ligase